MIKNKEKSLTWSFKSDSAFCYRTPIMLNILPLPRVPWRKFIAADFFKGEIFTSQIRRLTAISYADIATRRPLMIRIEDATFTYECASQRS